MIDAETLIEAIAERHDRAAFASLFAHFASRVKAYSRRLGAEPAVAEDIAQDVLISIWRRAPQFDRRKASAAAWIFSIARNRRIDLIRRARRPELDPNDPALVPAAEPAADRQAMEAQSEAQLRKAIGELPPDQAEIIRRAFFDEMSHSDIADQAGIPLGTVKSRIRLAMTKLRTAMEEYE